MVSAWSSLSTSMMTTRIHRTLTGDTSAVSISDSRTIAIRTIMRLTTGIRSTMIPTGTRVGDGRPTDIMDSIGRSITIIIMRTFPGTSIRTAGIMVGGGGMLRTLSGEATLRLAARHSAVPGWLR